MPSKLTERQEVLMTILANTTMIVKAKHEQDRAFIEDGKTLAKDGLASIGYDSRRDLYAIQITEAGRRALEDSNA